MAAEKLIELWKHPNRNPVCILLGAFLGTNTGVYESLTDRYPHKWYETASTGILGGILGGVAGLVFPYTAPLLVVAIPGYLAGKIVTHSSQIESRRMAETQEVLKGHENHRKEVPRESQLR